MNDSEVIRLFGRSRMETVEANIQKAYSYCQFFFEDHPMLRTKSAKSIQQEIINVAIDYSLEDACKQGLLDFVPRYSPNKRKNCHHLELLSESIVLTHCAISGVKSFPRKAYFRQQLSKSNQICWFDSEETVNGTYGIITHVHTETSSRKARVFLGIPDSDYNCWENYVDLTASFITNIQPELHEDAQLNLKLREHVRKISEKLG